MQEIRKIIIRTPNFLGDTINTTPCLQLVKKEYPQAEIVVVCPDFVADVFKYDPVVSRCITFPIARRNHFSTYRYIWKETRKEKADLGIIFINTFMSALIFKAGGVKCIIGYNTEGRGFLLDFKRKLNRNGHYINRYAVLFNEFTGNKYTYLPELHLPISGEQTFRFDNGQKTIGLYLGGVCKSFRRYPDDLSVSLLRLLHDNGYNLVLLGDRNDREKHHSYARHINSNIIDLTGKTDTEGMFNTIAHLDALITIDSSALHVAAALKIPFVVLLGLSTSPTSAILPKVSHGRALKIENNLIREEDYIRNINPEKILQAVQEVMQP